MMTATLVPPTAAPKTPASDLRFVAIRANLLPDEVVSARQAEVVRKQVLLALVVVLVLLLGWFGLSWWQTSSANGDLDSSQRQGIALQNQQAQFAPLVKVQSDVADIQSELQRLMIGDLSWKRMLTTLRAEAPTGVTITSVSGTLTVLAAAASGQLDATILNASGKPTVGLLTVSGTAPDKRSVAAYADRLATVPGLTAPLISSVEATAHPITFTVTVVITSDALGGRHAIVTVPTTTGGH
jgi:Tfp pilus assembly protein PilN